jgi:predicted nucleic acid-binding protein
MIDYARALSMVAKDDDAVQVLLTAEEKSPQLVRHSAIVREVVRTLYRRAPVTAGKKSSLLLALAERCRAVSET